MSITEIGLRPYQCSACGWQGLVRAVAVCDKERILYVQPVNPREVCPRCRTPLCDDRDQYAWKSEDDFTWPRLAYFSMTKGGPAHDEELWRWILGGGLDADTPGDSQIVRERLHLATSGYDLFARSQDTGSVVTVEAWEPPNRPEDKFVVLLYRRDTGAIVAPEDLPVEEKNKIAILAYVRRFQGL
ncbi:MAG: hypothetical protein AB1473_19810 [Thermodesulfobacteriota bacterium]